MLNTSYINGTAPLPEGDPRGEKQLDGRESPLKGKAFYMDLATGNGAWFPKGQVPEGWVSPSRYLALKRKGLLPAPEHGPVEPPGRGPA